MSDKPARTTGNEPLDGIDPGGTRPTRPGNPDKPGTADSHPPADDKPKPAGA